MTENRHFYSFINRCILHGRVFVMNTLFKFSVITDCNATTAITNVDSFHLDILTGTQYSYIDSLRIKQGHTFNQEEKKLVLNAISCFSGSSIFVLYLL